jgi:hypothetical protein
VPEQCWSFSSTPPYIFILWCYKHRNSFIFYACKQIFTFSVILLVLYHFRLDVKTIEESDRSGTDPEDESQSVADIQNVGDYEAIFQPNRKRM